MDVKDIAWMYLVDDNNNLRWKPTESVLKQLEQQISPLTEKITGPIV